MKSFNKVLPEKVLKMLFGLKKFLFQFISCEEMDKRKLREKSSGKVRVFVL